ncbi:MAG: C-GCAxxG-C-C family protein [Lachnospiraceae bacterium]|nr:C-GCAxxG-C-C family protein [Lachnospiraceae bacterium]
MNMTEDKAREGFQTGIDCSQAVLGACAPAIGMDEDAAKKLAAGFGGGMWHGQTCGCVTGALMALGAKYGNCKPGDQDTKQAFLAKKAEFEERFAAANESLVCKEILGYDLSDPAQMKIIMEKGLLMSVCPKLVVSACEILEDMLHD